MKYFFPATVILLVSFMTACAQQSSTSSLEEPGDTLATLHGKPVIYQVFTRLFGNTNTTNKPWGTIEENGVGKFNDFTDVALAEIKDLGATHIWYTGVLHHAVIRDYTASGISNDDPDVVKGRAGSPYAVKDYYSVNPDLAVDPTKRLEEFKALIDRTHKHGLKVIIDIVPNHIARDYQSLHKPSGVVDFGAQDDTSVEYHRDNNFYYVPDHAFLVPEPLDNYEPLGGEPHPLADGKFSEFPAKWTGNGARAAQPHFYDWYETVKINYGVRPDGSYDFPRLPEYLAQKNHTVHAQFWEDKDVPDSWKKFRDITHYWLALGVDGFRYDMAEMVPVEFWSYLNSSIKQIKPEAFLLAEIYNPSEYRNYIHLGKMDYLYDKVGFYDTLKTIMQGTGATDDLIQVRQQLEDIDQHMLHFLENHDEQRIASPEFAGDAEKGRPAMVVSTLISRAPTLIYFAQELGEPGAGDGGFGRSSRTTIFDYWGVPTHQRWMNHGKFDGEQLSATEKDLREFYARLLNFSTRNAALSGHYREIHSYNRAVTKNYNDKLISFVRWKDDERLLVISNFAEGESFTLDLDLPPQLVRDWQLPEGKHKLVNVLEDQRAEDKTNEHWLRVIDDRASVTLTIEPLASYVFALVHP